MKDYLRIVDNLKIRAIVCGYEVENYVEAKYYIHSVVNLFYSIFFNVWKGERVWPESAGHNYHAKDMSQADILHCDY